MPVHLTGRIANMDPIMELARSRGLVVIEDAAQAIGSRYRGKPAGSFGAVGCFSTHPLKNLNAIGDGGFITTNNDDISAFVRRQRNHGLVDRNTVEGFGLVSRMDALQAAVLEFRLGRLDEIIRRRRANAARYRELLDCGDIFIAPDRNVEFNTYHTFVIQLERRDALQRYLADKGIGTAIHYPIPIHLQPAAAALGHLRGDFPVTESQAERILTLPINPSLTDQQIEIIATETKRFLELRS